jgi:plastocyanin
MSPTELTVSSGTRVQFANNDTTHPNHDIQSDPHPEHTDCIEINQVGFIVPGQTKETGNLNTVRTCGFHDHNLPSDSRYQGRIIIR